MKSRKTTKKNNKTNLKEASYSAETVDNVFPDQCLSSIKDIIPMVVHQLDELMQSENGTLGMKTQYIDLDRLTSGLRAGDLIVIAARPAMGKSTFARNIAENIAIDAEKPVLMFNMEMQKQDVALQYLSSMGRVENSALYSGQIQDNDWSKIFSTMAIMSERMNMIIDDSPALTPQQIRTRARNVAAANNGLSLIIVDYLQLMKVPEAENRTNEVSEASRSLKALAKELNVPIIVISQLNRKCEERTDKRPMLSDMRDSGSIEDDADLIMFVYRDEVYNYKSPESGTAEILIRKNRKGPLGDVRLTFLGHYSRFDNFLYDESKYI